MSYDINKVRNDFPILSQKVYNKPLIYLDNGATTQKPAKVIEKITEFHSVKNSSIHRGIHFLSEHATEEYEKARQKVQQFIGAKNTHEIIFTSGTTGSINTVAFSFGERYIQQGDELIISTMEHHANIVPWQMLCDRKGAVLKIIPITDDGDLIFEEYEKLINEKTKLISVTHISNVLGTLNPIEKIIETAHKHNVPVLIDAAQSVQHVPIDVVKLDCDFLVFSGHKAYGPTGIGVLYGKEKWLDALPPYQGGGDMVENVTFEKTTYQPLPLKFEAGTTNYIGAIGLAAALDYLTETGLSDIARYEHELLDYTTKSLLETGYVKIYGNSKNKSSIVSFLIDNIHPSDTGMVIDKLGVAVRTGTHCAQPLMHRFGIDGTVRASIAMYNTREEIDMLCAAVKKVKEMFG
ncbi:MAG: cysteine desulfurase [Bacteroidales bacterium]|nr:cysteine desulfurase [Bacteroidales bacterium]